MTKVKHAASTRKHKKKTFKLVKGQYGARSKKWKIAKEAARKALIANYIQRKKKKRDFRSLWITRITAACKREGISYSRFIAALKKADITLNRKMLADVAAKDAQGFKAIVKQATL